MRVIAGRWRGRRITAPPGTETRPTADRVREGIFSAIVARVGSLASTRVLDLYAGSGALGIESLSRGAAHVTFVEADRRTAAVLRRNLDTLDAGAGETALVTGRAERSDLHRLVPEPVALLFADPPYRIDASQVTGIVARLAKAGRLEREALVIYEHARATSPEWPMGFVAVTELAYGDTAVSIARYDG